MIGRKKSIARWVKSFSLPIHGLEFMCAVLNHILWEKMHREKSVPFTYSDSVIYTCNHKVHAIMDTRRKKWFPSSLCIIYDKYICRHYSGCDNVSFVTWILSLINIALDKRDHIYFLCIYPPLLIRGRWRDHWGLSVPSGSRLPNESGNISLAISFTICVPL